MIIYLADATALTLCLRRKREQLSSKQLEWRDQLVEGLADGTIGFIGAVAQEVLTGVRNPNVFQEISEALESLSLQRTDFTDHVEAARLRNKMMNAGIAATPVDILQVAVSMKIGATLITADRDFLHFQQVQQFSLLFLEDKED